MRQVGIRGKDIVVLGVEKKAVGMLQDDRTVRKICTLDDHVSMAFAGLTADARVLIQRARIECQSYKLSVEDPVTVEYITRHIASLQQVSHLLHSTSSFFLLILFISHHFVCLFVCSQKYTQGRGRRPFGLSALIVGFDYDGSSHLYQTDPSGTYHEWKANAIGRNANSVREFLEKNYTDEIAESDDACIKLCVKALLEVVQSGSKNVEIAVARRNRPLEVAIIIIFVKFKILFICCININNNNNKNKKMLKAEEIENVMAQIEKENEAEAEKKSQKKQ